jgi:hypothetical protein
MKHDLRKEFLMMQKIPNILPIMNSLKSNTTLVKLNLKYKIFIFN